MACIGDDKNNKLRTTSIFFTWASFCHYETTCCVKDSIILAPVQAKIQKGSGIHREYPVSALRLTGGCGWYIFKRQNIHARGNMRKAIISISLLLLILACPILPRPLYAGEKEGAAAFARGDFKTAFMEFKPLAEKGLAEAQNALGIMYSSGNGVAKDYKEAVKWFKKAAEQGEASAQYNLGGMYYDGDGVAKDYKEAIKWFRKAAEQGLTNAQNSLGVKYAIGQGVTRDYKEAVKWYREAAEHGYADAQHNLGVMYYDGKGVTRDYVLSYKWFNIAASGGDESARKGLDALEEKMTSEQIAEAQKLSREFKVLRRVTITPIK